MKFVKIGMLDHLCCFLVFQLMSFFMWRAKSELLFWCAKKVWSMKFTLLIYIAIILFSAHENEHSSRHPKNNQNWLFKKLYNVVGLINKPGVAGDALQTALSLIH